MDAKVTWGLLAAWSIHDAEEVLTMAPWGRRRIPVLRERLPRVPERVWRAASVSSTAEAAVAVGAVGVVITGAAVAGAATDGNAWFYQAVLAGFGLHTVGHVASAVLTRGYTPGVVTPVLVAVPWSAWAWSRLGAQGRTAHLRLGDVLVDVLAAPLVAGSARLLDRLVVRR